MFGSTVPKDEFRILLKERLKYVEATGEVSNADLVELSRLLGKEPQVVHGWAKGTGRPIPQEELSAIVLLRGLKNFA